MSTKIVIAIPTCRRPAGLKAALQSIEKLTPLPDAAIEVLAVENNRQKTVQNLIDSFQKFPVHYALEESPGLVNVRNRILYEARRLNADYLAGLDDDETASPGWLRTLWHGLKQYNAAVATGPTLSRFEIEPPQWIVNGRFFRTNITRPTGSHLRRIGSNNFLLDMAFSQKHGMRFDPRFNFIGSEDTDFFGRIAANGGRLIWLQEAVLYETVPPARMTLRYLLKRDYRIGLGRAARARKKSLISGLSTGIWSLMTLLFYGMILPFHWTRASFSKRLFKLVKHVGVLVGLFRNGYKAYGAASAK